MRKVLYVCAFLAAMSGCSKPPLPVNKPPTQAGVAPGWAQFSYTDDEMDMYVTRRLVNIKWENEMLRNNRSFTVWLHPDDFDQVSTKICEYQSTVEGKGGQIWHSDNTLKHPEGPYVRVDLPRKEVEAPDKQEE